MTEQEPQAGSSSAPEVTTPPAAPPRQHRSIWLRELPFTIVLILTIAGVAYTTFSKTPIAGYWEILAPIIGLVCVGAGWQEAGDKTGRLRLIVTQALHGARRPGHRLDRELRLAGDADRCVAGGLGGRAVVALAGAARARNVTAGTEHLGPRVAHD